MDIPVIDSPKLDLEGKPVFPFFDLKKKELVQSHSFSSQSTFIRPKNHFFCNFESLGTDYKALDRVPGVKVTLILHYLDSFHSKQLFREFLYRDEKNSANIELKKAFSKTCDEITVTASMAECSRALCLQHLAIDPKAAKGCDIEPVYIPFTNYNKRSVIERDTKELLTWQEVESLLYDFEAQRDASKVKNSQVKAFQRALVKNQKAQNVIRQGSLQALQELRNALPRANFQELSNKIEDLKAELQINKLDTVAKQMVPNQESNENGLCTMPIQNARITEPARSINECLRTFNPTAYIKNGVQNGQLFGQVVVKKTLLFLDNLCVLQRGLMSQFTHDIRTFVGISLCGAGKINDNKTNPLMKGSSLQSVDAILTPMILCTLGNLNIKEQRSPQSNQKEAVVTLRNMYGDTAQDIVDLIVKLSEYLPEPKRASFLQTRFVLSTTAKFADTKFVVHTNCQLVPSNAKGKQGKYSLKIRKAQVNKTLYHRYDFKEQMSRGQSDWYDVAQTQKKPLSGETKNFYTDTSSLASSILEFNNTVTSEAVEHLKWKSWYFLVHSFFVNDFKDKSFETLKKTLGITKASDWSQVQFDSCDVCTVVVDSSKQSVAARLREMALIDYTGCDDFIHCHYSGSRCNKVLNPLFNSLVLKQTVQLVNLQDVLTPKLFTSKDTEVLGHFVKEDGISNMNEVTQKFHRSFGSQIIDKLISFIKLSEQRIKEVGCDLDAESPLNILAASDALQESLTKAFDSEEYVIFEVLRLAKTKEMYTFTLMMGVFLRRHVMPLCLLAYYSTGAKEIKGQWSTKLPFPLPNYLFLRCFKMAAPAQRKLLTKVVDVDEKLLEKYHETLVHLFMSQNQSLFIHGDTEELRWVIFQTEALKNFAQWLDFEIHTDYYDPNANEHNVNIQQVRLSAFENYNGETLDRLPHNIDKVTLRFVFVEELVEVLKTSKTGLYDYPEDLKSAVSFAEFDWRQYIERPVTKYTKDELAQLVPEGFVKPSVVAQQEDQTYTLTTSTISPQKQEQPKQQETSEEQTESSSSSSSQSQASLAKHQ